MSLRCVAQVYAGGRRRRCTAESTTERGSGQPVCDDHREPVKA